ncbi:flavin reductase (NADPH) [Agrilus planipennis]|uniref:Flavin reductase (NADPH) n=1 Tax=Agrilus planipennis TaxID=224129 RepID=A0A1W4WYK6_AGRPL|nr:flavin reductase (NADPH) [Agrilus planipennis]XP_018328928.1 flavin reductase (NADPH) [Agrilus planipennis]XP_018328929.1 flavin reductase (NADPH) [Agrilus planipennis]
MEKIVIFGSTGMTGVCAVDAGVKKGLNVRAFVRDPAKLPDHLRNSVEVVKGDVLNYTDVLNAIKNVTAVVVALGTRNDLKPTTDLSEGMKNIIKAMKELNVEIISVCLSAFLFYDPEKVPAVFKHLNADHQRQYDVLKESGLKYIAVFPPHIADQPGAQYEIKHDASPGRVVSKNDLGRFLIESLIQPEHYGKVCGICTKY